MQALLIQECNPLHASCVNGLQIAFDDVPVNTGKTKIQREEYWERSRRLQHGTLVALWWETQETQAGSELDPCITFATISVRNEQELAPGDVATRPRICIRYVRLCLHLHFSTYNYYTKHETVCIVKLCLLVCVRRHV